MFANGQNHMSNPQKFFRHLWRINAVLILLAAGAITFGVGTLLVGGMQCKSNSQSGGENGNSCRSIESSTLTWADFRL